MSTHFTIKEEKIPLVFDFAALKKISLALKIQSFSEFSLFAEKVGFHNIHLVVQPGLVSGAKKEGIKKNWYTNNINMATVEDAFNDDLSLVQKTIDAFSAQVSKAFSSNDDTEETEGNQEAQG